MDITKLNALSTEVLLKLRETVDRVLDARMDKTLDIGRIVTFTDKSGRAVEARVKKINRATVDVTETANSAWPGRLWRVATPMLVVVPIEREHPMTLKAEKPYVPASVSADEVW